MPDFYPRPLSGHVIKPMEFLSSLIDLILHLNKHLDELVSQYGFWTYGILFLIILGIVIYWLVTGVPL